ncbi:SH3 domain-containing protein [Streptomyces sp. NPDC101132]|uniref:SH3 domain-containing protein n=1 Tax=Streptomyces sp. NPDC101132 TaxID=3366110 RepID=UPI0037FC0D0C
MTMKTAALAPVVAAGLVLGAAGWAAGDQAAAPGRTADGRAAGEQRSGHVAAKAGYPEGVVLSKSGLNVRSKPTVYSKTVKTLKPHQKVLLNCQKRGGWVQGNPVWYRLQNVNGWVSARYVHNLKPVRAC